MDIKLLIVFFNKLVKTFDIFKWSQVLSNFQKMKVFEKISVPCQADKSGKKRIFFANRIC